MKDFNPAMKLHNRAFVYHNAGVFNSNYTDMSIETTYIRLWHGSDGALGVTTYYNLMVTWAHSFDIIGEMSKMFEL